MPKKSVLDAGTKGMFVACRLTKMNIFSNFYLKTSTFVQLLFTVPTKTNLLSKITQFGSTAQFWDEYAILGLRNITFLKFLEKIIQI